MVDNPGARITYTELFMCTTIFTGSTIIQVIIMSTFHTVSFLAVKDLKRDKKIAILVVCLIAFSYINITFFAAFINGLGNTFQEEIINTGTSHIIITPSENTNAKYIMSVSSLRKKIDLNPEVIASASHINVPITISFRSKEFPVSAIAIVPSEESRVTTTSTYILDGSFLSDGSNNEIVLGRFIAGEKLEDTIGRERFGALVTGLGASVGEVVNIKYPNGVQKEYKVRGIVGSEGFSSISQDVFITTQEAESVLNINDQASGVLVKLNDKHNANAVKKFILEQGAVGVEVKTWSEASSFVGAINSTFGIVNLATSLVGVVVVVTTIGIVVFINTSRKKRIIGVLKAIGMSSRQIMLIFVFQSFVLGLLGTAFGIGMFSAINYYTNANPIELPVGDLRPSLATDAVINAALLIMVSSVIAGYVPARLASKQKILETIKTVE